MQSSCHQEVWCIFFSLCRDQYQLWLGGTPNLQRLAKPYLQRMSIDNLESTLRPLLNSWKKTESRISFGQHIEDLGEVAVLSLLTGGRHEP